MRVALPLLALLLATGAAAPQTPAPATEGAEVDRPPVKIDPATGKAVCRETIQEVREELGLPRVDRGAAPDPDEPLLIAAVARTIDGCSVLVMRDDTSDVRPVPGPQEHRLMPAR
jgi:hypothetical protein